MILDVTYLPQSDFDGTLTIYTYSLTRIYIHLSSMYIYSLHSLSSVASTTPKIYLRVHGPADPPWGACTQKKASK